ncbi:uncharacterized protein B0I36DRAFT_324648 [Microdochium trichocladiopsis]|uniref:Uncharacterized protein n=1 Tax=Microdochium trichocladiopsis TaxID=1682393 RepID=A0A9P8Y5J8_9PEZI|nr:uncharacterized protein B0I36DRAFT_324648 [Microdochium trichocladiopsis]KAH7028843.1 hypothetical protein B0I36DRAFT_324648 [Microdochium trichocladiopsis]
MPCLSRTPLLLIAIAGARPSCDAHNPTLASLRTSPASATFLVYSTAPGRSPQSRSRP